jgi:hypothetical protein
MTDGDDPSTGVRPPTVFTQPQSASTVALPVEGPSGGSATVADTFSGLQLRGMPTLQAWMMHKEEDLTAIWRAGGKMIHVP